MISYQVLASIACVFYAILALKNEDKGLQNTNATIANMFGGLTLLIGYLDSVLK